MKIDVSKMQIAAQAAENVLKAIGHRHRLMILCQLVDGERPVGELARLVKVRASTMSQHLALLRRDGLVTTRREGQVIYYALASGPAQILLEALAQIYCDVPPHAPRSSKKTQANTHKTKKGKS